ncbi:zinc finger protein 692 isoform X1 [Pleurodeles waltl]|uniref:zinc finger protein 692 isoform X1 n=2 Tax=Pleurodeles waltl TaxID=8319 RepID=UPI0037094C87
MGRWKGSAMEKHSSRRLLRAPEEVRKQKRKELDARRSKCRIRIGSHLEQWCVLKEELGFSLHSQLAKFLLDSYSSSVAMVCTGQTDDDQPPGRFSVTADTLQQLIILCHDHSQDCGFIPNLKHRMPLERRGRARTLFWQCLAGHTFSWSFPLSSSEDDVPPTHAKVTNLPKSTEVETIAEQQIVSSTQRTLPPRSSRRPKLASTSRRPLAESVVKLRERTETATADITDIPTVAMEMRQEESQDKSVKDLSTGQDEPSDANPHTASGVNGVQSCASRPSNGRCSVERMTTRWQWAVLTDESPGRKRRTKEMVVPAPSPCPMQEFEPADLLNTREEVNAQEQVPCSVASPRDVSSLPSLYLDADAEQEMPGFGVTPEGLQADIETGIPDENSAEKQGQDALGDHAETPEDDIDFRDGLEDHNNTVSPPNIEQQKHKQRDEDGSQIAKKRIRKSAKMEILQCDYEGCGKIFSNRQYLNHHKKYQHVNQYTFTCSEPSCGKSFNFKKHLKEHEKRHSDKRDFICEFCARGFRTSSNLVIHRRIHTGEKPLQCEICGVTCRQKASLNWHMKKHDADSFYLFSCDTCGKKFEKRDNVTAHKKKKHPDPTTPSETHEVPVSEGLLNSQSMSLLEPMTENSNAATSGAPE